MKNYFDKKILLVTLFFTCNYAVAGDFTDAVFRSTVVLKTALRFVPLIIGAMLFKLAIIWTGKKLNTIISQKKQRNKSKNKTIPKPVTSPLYQNLDVSKSADRLKRRSIINKYRRGKANSLKNKKL